MSRKLPPSQRPERQGRDDGPAGSEGLKVWVERYADHFRSAYREAIRKGWPSDLILLATPHSRRIDDRPQEFMTIPRTNRGMVTRMLPSLRGLFDEPASDGGFYVVASCGEGAYRGSYVAVLSSPTNDEPLPTPGVVGAPGSV